MLVGEQRRNEILQKLQREREVRKALIEQGRPQAYLDDQIVRDDVVDYPEDQTDTLNDYVIVEVSAENEKTITQSLCFSQGSDNIIMNQQKQFSVESQVDKKMQEQRERLKEMKKQLFSTKEKKLCDRLAHSKKDMINQRLMEKQENDNKVYQQACTFKPEMNEASKVMSQIKYSQYEGQDVATRFNMLEKDRLQHIEDLKFKQSQSEIYVQPSNFVMTQDQLPLHQRLAQVVKDKQALLQNLHENYLREERNQFDFQPQINAQSEVIAMIKNDGETVTQRLTKFNNVQQRVEVDEHSFQPSVNSFRNFEVVGRLGLSEDFLERQQQLEKIRFQRLSTLEQRNSHQNACTFQPKLNSVSEEMLPESRGHNIVDRLYSQELDKRSQHMKLALDQKNQEFTHIPTLNRHSKALAAERCFQDLVHDQSTRKEQLRLMAEEQYQEECSFYPATSTNPRYSNIQSPYTFDNCSEKIQEQTEQKERQRREVQRQQEAIKMSECTFKPQTNRRISGLNDPLQEVNGVESYMLKLDLLNRKKQEQNHREEKLFEMHKQYDANKHSHETKPEPFKLSQKPQHLGSYGKGQIKN